MWNLTRLAETLLPLIDDNQDAAIAAAQAAINTFPTLFNAAHAEGLRRKVGALTGDGPTDTGGAKELLEIMAEGAADFTLTFRGLADTLEDRSGLEGLRALFKSPEPFDAWFASWLPRVNDAQRSTRVALMRTANPAVIPRNHRVEEAIAAAVTDGDFEPFDLLVGALASPYDAAPANAAYRTPPKPDEIVRATFCGT